MSVDPMAFVQEARPRSAMPLGRPEPGAMRKLRDTFVEDMEGHRIPVEQLDGRNPAVYRDRIPPPPCIQCGADHNPIATAKGQYDHPYKHPDQADDHGLVVLSSPPPAQTPSAVSGGTAPPARRISIFPGRGDDDYIVVVETRQDDDWEDEYKKKMTGDALATVLPILDALGVKLKDRTGGDLVELREREPA